MNQRMEDVDYFHQNQTANHKGHYSFLESYKGDYRQVFQVFFQYYQKSSQNLKEVFHGSF